MRSVTGFNHSRSLLHFVAVLGFTLSAAAQSHAQRATLYDQVSLPAAHSGALRARFETADRLLNGVELARAQLLDALRNADTPAKVRDARYSRYLATDLFVDPPRFPTSRGTPGEAFRQLVPEAQAMLDWTHAFRRQVYDVLADARAGDEERLARITELLGYYRSRPAVAITTRPKEVGALNAQIGATAFRASHPRVNGQMWAAQWLELAILESLGRGETPAGQIAAASAATRRFREMLNGAPASAPYLMPLSTAVAPTFAQRFADAAAILDNLHLLQDYIADLMVAREIPRSAHRREIMRALEFFRNDSTAAAPFATWANSGTVIGVANMGGPGVGFAATPESPTVPRGMSLASASSSGTMAGMDHGATARGNAQDTSSARAILDRMLADPVIRERAATDPVLQRMMQQESSMASMGGMQHGAMNMPSMRRDTAGMAGMQHDNMPMGQTPNAMSGMNMIPMSAEERRLRDEFIFRLLADPTIESRIHADPQLHRLWSDPDVQRRLLELRGTQRAPAANPAPPPASSTQHRHP